MFKPAHEPARNGKLLCNCSVSRSLCTLEITYHLHQSAPHADRMIVRHLFFQRDVRPKTPHLLLIRPKHQPHLQR